MAGNSKNTLAIGSAGTITVIFLLFAMISLFTGGNANAGPNPSGSQAEQRTIPTDIYTKPLLQGLEVLSDPSAVLQHPEKLDPLKNSLNQLLTDLTGESTKPEIQNLPEKGKIRELIGTMLAQVNSIQANATNNPDEARKNLQALIKLRDEVNRISIVANTSIVEAAKTIVDYNVSIGNKIHYSNTKRSLVRANGFPVATDCSGFVSHALHKVGVLPKLFPSTSGFFSLAKAGSRSENSLFSFAVYENARNFSNQEVAVMADSGKILPGDILLSLLDSNGKGLGKMGFGHVVIYMGKINGEHMLTESGGGSSGPDGPKYSKLISGYNRKIMAAVRVNAGTLTSRASIPAIEISEEGDLREMEIEESQ
jgi:hypothetical protein